MVITRRRYACAHLLAALFRYGFATLRNEHNPADILRGALIVPRVKPREEQLLRAQRASELGLVDMLLPDQSANPAVMAEALKRLPSRLPPSKSGCNMRLEGLDHISETVGHWLDNRGGHLSLVGAE